jgi:hypothetical protein
LEDFCRDWGAAMAIVSPPGWPPVHQEEGRLWRRLQRWPAPTTSRSTTPTRVQRRRGGERLRLPHRWAEPDATLTMNFELPDLLMGEERVGTTCGRRWRGRRRIWSCVVEDGGTGREVAAGATPGGKARDRLRRQRVARNGPQGYEFVFHFFCPYSPSHTTLYSLT